MLQHIRLAIIWQRDNVTSVTAHSNWPIYTKAITKNKKGKCFFFLCQSIMRNDKPPTTPLLLLLKKKLIIFFETNLKNIKPQILNWMLSFGARRLHTPDWTNFKTVNQTFSTASLVSYKVKLIKVTNFFQEWKSPSQNFYQGTILNNIDLWSFALGTYGTNVINFPRSKVWLSHQTFLQLDLHLI